LIMQAMKKSSRKGLSFAESRGRWEAGKEAF